MTGGLLRRTFGLAVGGDFNIELLLVCNVAGAIVVAATELAEAPVLRSIVIILNHNGLISLCDGGQRRSRRFLHNAEDEA